MMAVQLSIISSLRRFHSIPPSSAHSRLRPPCEGRQRASRRQTALHGADGYCNGVLQVR